MNRQMSGEMTIPTSAMARSLAQLLVFSLELMELHGFSQNGFQCP
jgi:hypothetical protein